MCCINNLITIKGGVPGPTGGLVRVEKQGVIKGYTPPPEEKPDEEERNDRGDGEDQHADQPESDRIEPVTRSAAVAMGRNARLPAHSEVSRD